MRIAKRCKSEFSINVDYADEVEYEDVSLNSCDEMFGNPYFLYMEPTPPPGMIGATFWNDFNFFLKTNLSRRKSNVDTQ